MTKTPTHVPTMSTSCPVQDFPAFFGAIRLGRSYRKFPGNIGKSACPHAFDDAMLLPARRNHVHTTGPTHRRPRGCRNSEMLLSAARAGLTHPLRRRPDRPLPRPLSPDITCRTTPAATHTQHWKFLKKEISNLPPSLGKWRKEICLGTPGKSRTP